MTTEHAAMILRRKPQDDRERAIRREALATLARAGYSPDAIEMEGMTRLHAADLEAIHEAAVGV